MIIRQATRIQWSRTLHTTAWSSSRIVRTRASVPSKKRSPPATDAAAAQHRVYNDQSMANVQDESRMAEITSHNAMPVSQETTSSPELSESPLSRLPVIVPEDTSPLTISQEPWAQALRDLLAVPCLVVARQLEMMNVLLGYEQANKYQLLDENGTLRGYLVEEELGMGSMFKRQLLGTHRPFRALLLSPEGQTLLVIRRPFNWINSRIFVATPSESTSLNVGEADSAVESGEEIIGEAQQEWHLYRRRYNQFIRSAYNKDFARTEDSLEGTVPDDNEMEQFGKVDAGLLAWDFVVEDESGRKIASINRNFSGLARELFTDTGQYVIRFEAIVDEHESLPSPQATGVLPAPQSAKNVAATSRTTINETSDADSTALVPAQLPSLTYSQRAILLATAISADFDYFSRHSGSHGGIMGPGFLPIPMGGYGGQPNAPAPAPAPGTETGEVDPDTGRIQGSDRDGGNYERERSASPYGQEPVPGQGQGWDDQVMQDPWAAEPPAEEGGSWGWNDLFPNDTRGDDDGGGGGDWGGDGGDW